MNIETELQKVTGVKPKKKEDKQKYLVRLVKAVGDLDETEWDSLSEEAQLWYEPALRAEEKGSEIKDFPAEEEEAEEEADEDTEEEAEEEETEDEDTEEETEEEAEEEEAPKKKKGKKVKAKAEAEEEEDSEEEDTEEAEEEDSEDENEDEDEDDQPKKKLKGKPMPVASNKKSEKLKAKKADKVSKKKAAAPEKKAKSKGNGTKAGKYKPDQKITVLAKENPRREGTDGYANFKLYKTGMTIADFQKKGNMSKLATDVKRGHVKVS